MTTLPFLLLVYGINRSDLLILQSLVCPSKNQIYLPKKNLDYSETKIITRSVIRQHSSPGIGVILDCQGAL